MALTREFKETVVENLRRDSRFRRAMLAEAIQEFLDGDIRVGKLLLRDYINATIGFTQLSKIMNKNPKSVQRMTGLKGNPRAENIFAIIKILKDHENLSLSVKLQKRKVA
jgi:DNA-binding phage protein